MNRSLARKCRTLERIVSGMERIAVAVSGGVDSMTLSVVATRTLTNRAEMFHAVSAAVPPEATERVRRYAEREGWRLHLFRAGEFDDADYMRNPLNRCYFCKTNLYRSIAAQTRSVITSGTNLDDLGDYRPGLEAAKEYSVRHPFVEANIDKSTVRAIARFLGLAEVAELPASPCLSSRIETGITIDPRVLYTVNAIERYLRRELVPRTVRCRVRGSGIVVELDQQHYDALSVEQQQRFAIRIRAMCGRSGIRKPVRFAPYEMGSAFVDTPRMAGL